MKKWFLDRFLPLWAKETVLRDNKKLTLALEELRRENDNLRCYIRGLHKGLRKRGEAA